MNWVSIMHEYPEDNSEALELIQTVRALAFELKSNKNKSTVWDRLGGRSIYAADPNGKFFYHEILIPGMSDRNMEILKDLNYDIKPIVISKKSRRASYQRVEKPKKEI